MSTPTVDGHDHRGLTDHLLQLPHRLSARLRALHDHERSEARQFAANGVPARGSPAHALQRESDGDRLRRLASFNRIIESAVRRGAMWDAMKYELARDLEILKYEIEHDLDLLIAGMAEPRQPPSDRTRTAS